MERAQQIPVNTDVGFNADESDSDNEDPNVEESDEEVSLCRMSARGIYETLLDRHSFAYKLDERTSDFLQKLSLLEGEFLKERYHIRYK